MTIVNTSGKEINKQVQVQRLPVSDLHQEHQIFQICLKIIIYLIIYLKL